MAPLAGRIRRRQRFLKYNSLFFLEKVVLTKRNHTKKFNCLKDFKMLYAQTVQYAFGDISEMLLWNICYVLETFQKW